MTEKTIKTLAAAGFTPCDIQDIMFKRHRKAVLMDTIRAICRGQAVMAESVGTFMPDKRKTESFERLKGKTDFNRLKWQATREAGLCGKCGKPSEKTYCIDCATHRNNLRRLKTESRKTQNKVAA